MCGTIYGEGFAKARNGSILAIGKETKAGKFKATVVKSTARKFPIGHQVTIQNDMGHVLCKGENETGEECELHPLDATEMNYGGAFSCIQDDLSDAVAGATREALRRRRYNLSRANRPLFVA